MSFTTSFLKAPVEGFVYGTEFYFTDTTSGTIVNRTWDLGDGTILYGADTVKHIYKHPGLNPNNLTYVVKLTSINNNGEKYIAEDTVKVDYLYRDSIRFSEIPQNYSIPGLPTPTPFKVEIFSAQIVPTLHVTLHVDNSRSIPSQFVTKKWNFLTPKWRFVDTNNTIIETLSVATTPLYFNNKVVGVSGVGEFYYIDDLSSGDPTTCPLLITATLQPSGFINYSENLSLPSYANTKTSIAATIWKVYNIQPTEIDVTSNYLTEITPIKWTGIKIPIFLSTHGFRKNPITEEVDRTGILFSFPENNIQGLNYPITISLSGVPSSYYEVDSPVYFQTYDSENNFVGGYIFTTITPLSPIDNTSVRVTTDILINPQQDPDSFLWVSNPENNKIHRIFISPYTEDILESCQSVYNFIQENLLTDGKVQTYDVPYSTNTNTFNYNLSGFSGVFGIAPIIQQNEVILSDAELDCIYKYTTDGILLSTLQLSSIGGFSPYLQSYGPSNISLDENFNFYVTLFNSVSVLKFDQNFNLVNVLIPNNLLLNITTEYGDNLLKPPALEVDKENNVWVSYAHSLCCCIVKYDGITGANLIEVPLEVDSIPVAVAINKDNNVWVAKNFNRDSNRGELTLYDTFGVSLTSFSNFNRPSFIAVDRFNKLWFTYNIRNLGYLDPLNGATKTWMLSISGDLQSPQSPIDSEDEEIGGLGIDIYNRVCVIDSLSNFLYVLPNKPTSLQSSNVRRVKLLPDSIIGYVPNIDNTFSYSITGTNFKSAQANGDWTGAKYFLKFVPELTSINIQSQSNPFTVFDINNPSSIRKINESFNMSEYLKTLALPEILKQNDLLFDELLGGIVGTAAPSAFQDLGQTLYEKIGNFTINHGDVDTCNINQLRALNKLTGLPPHLDYGINLPVEVQNALNLTSIPKNKLWGIQSPLPIINLNSYGEQLTTNSLLTAGQKILLKNKFNNVDTTLVTVPIKNNTTTYPVIELNLPGYIEPLHLNYYFYKYIPTYNKEFVENIIDWESEYTTISPTASSNEKWYGDRGVVEQIFNYLLIKNLYDVK